MSHKAIVAVSSNSKVVNLFSISLIVASTSSFSTLNSCFLILIFLTFFSSTSISGRTSTSRTISNGLVDISSLNAAGQVGTKPSFLSAFGYAVLIRVSIVSFSISCSPYCLTSISSGILAHLRNHFIFAFSLIFFKTSCFAFSNSTAVSLIFNSIV